MKAKIKKLLLLLLICVLVTGLLPASALAAKDAAATNSVTVYFTVEGTGNNRTGFVEAGGYSMALQKLTVPYFDLALYGLEEIYYNPDCYAGAGASSQVAGTKETAEGNVTILHLFIYATEVFRLDVDPKDAGQGYLAEAGWPYFNFHQVVPGSTFVNFWEYGYNINYYLNYMYPLAKPGWGSTCDQILLKDGDVVTVRFENNNGNCGTFHHFGETGLVTKEISKGNQLNMTLYQTTKTADYSGTGHEPVGAGYTVKVVSEIGDEVLAETKTNEYGDFRLDTSKLPKGR